MAFSSIDFCSDWLFLFIEENEDGITLNIPSLGDD